MPGSTGPLDGHSGLDVAVVVATAGAEVLDAGADVLDGVGLAVVEVSSPPWMEQAASPRTAVTSPMCRSFLCIMIEKARAVTLVRQGSSEARPCRAFRQTFATFLSYADGLLSFIKC